MTQDHSIPIQKRAVHFDLVRFIATFIVVQLHVATPWLWREADVDSGFWITCLVFDTFGRVGVPIFLMISGALLLSKEETYGSFFKKRFVRVLIPLVFWTIIYETKIAIEFYINNPSAEFDVATLYTVLKNPIAGPVYDHLWFLYMIIGMYLVTPFLRRIIPVLRKQDLFYLLGLWIFSNIALPLIYNFSSFKLGLNIPVVTSYLGFYVLGYYLMQYQFNAKQIKIAWITFVCSYLLNILMVWFDSHQAGKVDIFFLSHHRPGIFIQAVSAFILLEHYAIKAFARFSEKKYKLLAYLGSVTFGIYLLHPLVIELLEMFFMGVYGIYPPAMYAAPAITIPIAGITATAVTMGLVTLMQKTPLLKEVV